MFFLAQLNGIQLLSHPLIHCIQYFVADFPKKNKQTFNENKMQNYELCKQKKENKWKFEQKEISLTMRGHVTLTLYNSGVGQ